MTKRHRLLSRAPALLLAALLAPASGLCAGPSPEDIFAEVNGARITLAHYAGALRNVARRTFYHGSPPENQLREFQRRVADELIDRLLIQQEGIRRGVCQAPDMLAIEQPEVSESCQASLRAAVEAGVPEPDAADAREYYEANPEAFVEPAQRRVSLILLGVSPSAGQEEWIAAREKAADLHARLEDGASFAELARQYSTDASAEKGGDMGYLHSGMLGKVADDALAGLQQGETTEPVTLLEGWALFRLDEFKPAQQRSFADVRERAAGLWARERRQAAWDGLLHSLRRDADMTVDERYFEPRGPEVSTVSG